MKSVVAGIGMLATVANAYSHPRAFHFARNNGTDESQTTLTVLTTQVHTITSCAPTVTNCPARNDQTALASLPASDLTTAVVTDTIVLTEVVCPVSEAAEVSKSVLSQAATGGITGTTLTAPLTSAPAIPLSTGYPAGPQITSAAQPVGEGDDSLTTIVSDYITKKTLTITLGTGTDTSVVTSTIQSTVQSTIVITKTLENGEAEETGTSGAEGAEGAGGDEPTTTTTATSTGTITKTVQRAGATETAVAGESDAESEGSGSDSGECVPTTVTVTEAATTVYVTVSAGNAGSATTAASEAATTGTEGESDAESETGEDDGEAEGDDDEDDEEACDPEEDTTTVQATVTVVPYPVNGTAPTSGYAAPTGFARFVR